jgi:hypothetical protein
MSSEMGGILHGDTPRPPRAMDGAPAGDRQGWRPWAMGMVVAALLLCALSPATIAADFTLLPDDGQDDYDVALDLPPPGEWPANAEVRIAFDYRNSQSYHVACLHRDEVWFEEVNGGQTDRLGPAGRWPQPAEPLALTIKRRAWEMEVLANGRKVAAAYDDEPYGGHVGFACTGLSLAADDVLVQPTAPVHFTDDFMRDPGEQTPWETPTGVWRNVGMAGGKGDLRADLSANPFSYHCQADGPALATAGDWFWDSYDAQVAARAAADGGAIGLAFYVQDARNYYLLAVSDHQSTSSAQQQLVRVVDGQPTLLGANTGGYVKNVWYELRVRVSNGLIEGYVDGKLRLSAYDNTFGQGKAGLWARDVAAAWFDDVKVNPWWAFADPLAGPDLGSWMQAGGQWHVSNGTLTATSTFEKPATIFTGARRWHDYEIAADVAPGNADAVGLYACAEDSTNWYLFRWSRGAPVGTWQLLSMDNGRPASLGVVPGNLQPNNAQRMSLAVQNGLIRCAVDGEPVITAASFARSAGRAGLRADGGESVQLGNLTVRTVEEPYQPVPIAAKFTQEQTMVDWARPSSDWRADSSTGFRWFRLPIFHDVSVHFPFRLAGAVQSSVRLLLGSVAQEEGFMAGGSQVYSPGVEVECTSQPDGKLAVTCRRGGMVLGQATAKGGATDHAARIDKAGLTTRVWIDEEPLIACHDGTWLESSGLGLAYQGATVDLNKVETYSTNLLQYTFSEAPTDWVPQSGVWRITDRWACFPGWAWFGGSKHASPTLWSKKALFGDQTFEFWAALEMDTSPKRGGYSHPSDINCTICADGQNLCSGYSFVFAGDNNTVTKILRGNTVVAQTGDVRFTNPTTGNMDFHRHWFHITVVRTGQEVHMAVDGRWVLQWRDPQPISGGHAALWTYNNNGILIARVRASGEIVQ